MFKHFIAATLVGLVVLGAAPAHAETERTFEIFNRNTGRSIQRVWTAPNSEETPWIPANLTQAISPRSIQQLTLGWGPSCFFDVRVEFTDGYIAAAANINVCSNQRVLVD